MRKAVPMRAMCTVNLVLLHSSMLTVGDEEYKSLRSSVCSFLHFPVTSSRFYVKYMSNASY